MSQNLLEKYPGKKLAVYTVWMPMLVTDERSKWDTGVLADARVRHFWDGERVVGTWLAEADVGGQGYAGIVWDAYFLFSEDARWDEQPTGLVASGAPVIGETDTLERSARRLLS